ncbi:MAG TPA: hypothetical protein VMT03_14140 [Polyangia bacterium]|nr:hypothetical protein [Polyangia bacterium]
MKVSKQVGIMWTLLVVAPLAGCGGAGAEQKDSAAQGPVYVVSTGVSSGDDFFGYLTTVGSLDPGTTFSLDGAIEVDPSWIFSSPGKPYVYAASLLQPTIDRYLITDSGALARDATVSFANLGVQSAYLAASAPIYSDDKSYFVDDAQDQMVIWNPAAMTIIGTIPFGDQPEGALPPQPEGTVVVHDGLIMTAIDWSDSSSDPSLYGSKVRLLGIDPATDTIVQSTTDARITYASPLAQASDGTVYYSPPSFVAAEIQVAPGHGSPSQALSVGPTSAAFDPTFDLDLSALVGGRPAGDFILLDDQTAIVRAWHADLADPVTEANWKDVLWTEAGFLWWRWHVGDAQAIQIPNQSPGALGASVTRIDGKLYVVRTSADSTTSTLDEIDAQGEFTATLSGPGQLIGAGAVRVR